MSNDKSKAPRRAKALYEAIPLSLPKPVDGNKIQACTQRTNEHMHDYFNRLEIAFKENFRCPIDTESTTAAALTLFGTRNGFVEDNFSMGGAGREDGSGSNASHRE